MEEIDLVQLENEFNEFYLKQYYRENPKYGIENSLQLIFTLVSAYANVSLSIKNIPSFMPCAALVLILIKSISEKVDLKAVKEIIKENSIADIKEIIKCSEEYKQLEADYETYISSLASFMKSQGIEDGLGVAFLYDLMLSNGYLSVNHKHTYNKNINQQMAKKYEILDMWGSRITTGSSVCRHMSAGLTDLENKVGNKSMTACVATVDKKTSLQEFSKYIANHGICLISNGQDELFGYCPTNHHILKLLSRPMPKEIFSYLECRPILGIIDYNYKYISKETDTFITKNNSYDEIRKFFSLDNLSNPNPNHITVRRTDVLKYFHSDLGKKEIQDFYLENFELVNKISAETDYLMPITKEKVKQLIIRK